MNRSPRHVYFPAPPAITPGVEGGPVLDALIEGLRSFNAVELVLESFDASWSADSSFAPSSIREREEYVIPLDLPGKARWESLASGHRRQVKKGDRSALRVEHPEGEEALALLIAVQEEASRRAIERGNGFSVKAPALRSLENTGSQPWGATMFAAWKESTPLAAALVGWANRRAFYLMGGSTPAGYECGASIWLHWQIASRLADAGFTTYNLGGSGPSATSPEDPAHGLHRFKSGFGARVVQRRSLSWSLSPSHARIHRVGRWLTATSSASSRDP
jgi:hypothetical protein